MPTTGGAPSRSGCGERLLDGAREARELDERQRAAADAGHRLLDRSVDESGQPLGPLAHGLDGLVDHSEHGDLGAGLAPGSR